MGRLGSADGSTTGVRGLESPRCSLVVDRRSGVFMIALLPVGVAKPSDENLPEGVEHAKANGLWQEGPAEIGPGRTTWF